MTACALAQQSSSKAQHNFSRTLSQADEQLREQDRLREELQQMRLQLEQAEQHHNRLFLGCLFFVISVFVADLDSASLHRAYAGGEGTIS